MLSCLGVDVGRADVVEVHAVVRDETATVTSAPRMQRDFIMAKTPRPWIVTRHDAVEKLEENLWAVAGDVPGVPVQRRMSIVKLSNGELLFFNAIPLEDALLEEVRSWGRPSMLVVPHHQHMIDAHAFREKLGLKLYGPAECAEAIGARAELTGALDAIKTDGDVTVQPLPGVKLGEPAIVVRSPSGRVSVLFGDAIQNTRKETLNLPFRLMGFGGGPKVVPVFKMMFVKDKPRLKERLTELSELEGLARVVPSHGEIVASAAGVALKSAASAA